MRGFFALWLVASLILTGCYSSDKDAIRLGVVLPLTGDYSIYGVAAHQGAAMAVQEINQRGGVHGRSLELIIRDNRTEPFIAQRAARELVEIDKVTALIGPVSSAARDAVLTVSEKYEIPLLYGMDYEGGRYSPWLICYSAIPEHYVDPVVPELINSGGKRFYIFGYDYQWPHSMAHAIEQAVAAAGGEIVGKEFTPFGRRDFRAVLDRIVEARADNLMLMLPGKDGFTFLRQSFIQGYSKHFQTMAFTADENYLFAMRGPELEGIYTAMHYFESNEFAPDSIAFSDAFLARYPEHTPTAAARSHYDLVNMLALALERAEPEDGTAVLAAMKSLTLVNNNSTIRMREDHHFDLPVYLARFEQGYLPVKKFLGVVSPSDQRAVVVGSH